MTAGNSRRCNKPENKSESVNWCRSRNQWNRRFEPSSTDAKLVSLNIPCMAAQGSAHAPIWTQSPWRWWLLATLPSVHWRCVLFGGVRYMQRNTSWFETQPAHLEREFEHTRRSAYTLHACAYTECNLGVSISLSFSVTVSVRATKRCAPILKCHLRVPLCAPAFHLAALTCPSSPPSSTFLSRLSASSNLLFNLLDISFTNRIASAQAASNILRHLSSTSPFSPARSALLPSHRFQPYGTAP